MGRVAVMQTANKLRLAAGPPLLGDSPKSPPSEPLGLQPGEWVRVKPAEQIRSKLNDKGANRGLWFDREMLESCGSTYQVRKRVGKLINETTGEMIHLKNDCIMLEGGVCSGEYSSGRWFCSRRSTWNLPRGLAGACPGAARWGSVTPASVGGGRA